MNCWTEKFCRCSETLSSNGTRFPALKYHELFVLSAGNSLIPLAQRIASEKVAAERGRRFSSVAMDELSKRCSSASRMVMLHTSNGGRYSTGTAA
jgi:hypothetical protein